ncbi:MAG: phage holin family protein [Clostridium sp.]|jgi:bacteriophage holin|nr:phage holin family protein [Clostridium sp.]MCI7208169.1 phage holin family protein [Clostridium sp.]
MKQIFKSLVTRLNNKGTIVSLAALIVSLLCQFGLNIDSEKILTIVQTICSILIILGLLNDPTDSTKGYIPGVSDKLVNKTEK